MILTKENLTCWNVVFKRNKNFFLKKKKKRNKNFNFFITKLCLLRLILIDVSIFFTIYVVVF